MRLALAFLAAALCLVTLAPAATADHVPSHDDPLSCEDGDPSGVCMDYCLYGLGPSWGISVLHGDDVVRVWRPYCWIM